MSEEQKSPKLKQEEALAAELNEFLEKRNAELVQGLTFPIYNKLPVELELAMAIIKKHEPQFVVDVVIKDEADKPQQLKTVQQEKTA